MNFVHPRLIAPVLLALTSWLVPAARAQVDETPDSPAAVFLEAWRITKLAFYDPDMRGVDWDAVRDELLPRARAAATQAELSAVINDALSRLKASHTGHYAPHQREYYELLDIFHPDGVPERAGSKIRPGPVEYVGIGLATRVIDGRVFVEDVYDTGPAAEAGILPGDELIAVEGGPWGDVEPFRNREGLPTTVTIQRTPDPSSRRDLTVTPRRIRPRELFLDALNASAQLIGRDGCSIAYVRVRSYGHRSYHEALRQLLADTFADADGLVIDLRGGWGGASPAYMDIFNPVAPRLTYRDREGKERNFDPTWRRPVALLIDGGTRSGKEALAHAFKTHRIGPLAGERTAGAVLAGTPRPLADGSVLYVAVADVTVDGVTLEGVGVEPDVVAPRRLPYAAGRDEQRDAAVAEVARLAAQRGVR